MVCLCCVCDIVHVLVLAIIHALVPYHFYNFYATPVYMRLDNVGLEIGLLGDFSS